jgi:nucleotide-binding universal stress UspA family protein
MSTFSRILVAVDGSSPSDAAVQLALRTAAPPHQTVRFVGVLDRDAIAGGYTADPMSGVAMLGGLRAAEAEHRRALDAASSVASAAGVESTSVLRTGRAIDAILAEAHEWNASCIAIGTHGRHGIARALLGSCAEGVLRRSDVPVLVAHTGFAAGDPEPFERILCAVDDSPAAKRAFDAASSLAVERHAELHVLSVVDEVAAVTVDGTNPAGSLSTIYAQTWKTIDALTAGCGGTVKRHVVAAANVAERIVRYANDEGCNLIVVGTHGRGGLPRAILGSTAEAILRSSAIPVLAYRDPSERRIGVEVPRTPAAAPLPG